MKTFRFLSIETRGEVVEATINRSGDRNSINTSLMAELQEFYDLFEKTDARAVVFKGAGDRYFIGGADGIEMMGLTPDGARAFSVRIQALFNRMEQSPLINVAAIDGLCFGGGYEFALACDLRVATETSRIGLPEVKVGLIPGGGGTQRLKRVVGIGAALRMILSGKLYSGPEAAGLGLVHLCVGHDELSRGVGELLAPVLRLPRYVLPLAKSAVYAGRDDMEEGLRIESERFRSCFEHDHFTGLMREQLESGVLTTTEKIESK